jgi:hypothetical protein
MGCYPAVAVVVYETKKWLRGTNQLVSRGKEKKNKTKERRKKMCFISSIISC